MSAEEVAMDSEAGLLPCPFCGDEARESDGFNEDSYWCVYCIGCQASTAFRPTVEQAVSLWNTRAKVDTASAARRAAERISVHPRGEIILDGDRRVLESVPVWIERLTRIIAEEFK